MVANLSKLGRNLLVKKSYDVEMTRQEQEKLDRIMDQHVKMRKRVMKLISDFIQDSFIDEGVVLDLNRLATDYVSSSQFALLPLVNDRLDDQAREKFIENSIAFSYMTNVIFEHPESRTALSLMIDLLTDRFIEEDKVFVRAH